MPSQPDLRPEDVPDRGPEDLPSDALEELDDIFDELTDRQTDGIGLSPEAEEPSSSTESQADDEPSLRDHPMDRAEHTDDALGVWRARADLRRAAYQKAEESASNRRGVLTRALTVGFMMGLFLAWGITEIILRIDEPGPETVSAGALAELEANTVQVSASQAALSGEARIPEIPEKHRPKIKENPTPTIVASPLPEPVVLEETFDPNVQVENFQSWMWRNHYWWQFDFEGTDALHLRWVGPDGQVKLQGWACENRVSTTIGRCYVGQSLTHFAPKPGTWSLYACKDAEFSACALVDQFDIAEGLDVGRSSAPK